MAAPNKVTIETLSEILRRWNLGENQQQIGAALGLNRGTVASHLRRVLRVETPEWKGRGRVALQAVVQPKLRPAPVIYPDNPPRLVVPFELSPGEAARFWPKVAAPNENGCRLWLASTRPGGEGQFGTAASASEAAYRVAWRLTYGPIPDGMNINHRCDVRPCNEPTHLWQGTQAENLQDMAAKGRAIGCHPDQSAENSRTAKLTWEIVREIRRIRETEGWTLADLATKFGMSKSQMSYITTYKQWTDDPLQK